MATQMEQALPAGELYPVSGRDRLEEVINSALHGVGLAACVGGTAVLVTLASLWGSAWHIVSFSIYGASLIVLYATSTVYHGMRHPGRKRVLRVMDHASVFLLIAGTYTPFTLVPLNGGWGWSIFGVVWGFSLLGIAFKLFFTGRFDRISTLLYVLLGWVMLIAVVPLVRTVPVGGLVLLLLGGISYTVGAGLYLLKRIPFNHALWHVFVLAGSALHFFSILFYVLL